MEFNIRENYYPEIEHQDEVIKYYENGHSREETVDYFNMKYDMSKNSIREIIIKYRKDSNKNVSYLIDSLGGVIFIKELIRNDYNLKGIAKALNITYTSLKNYCDRRNFHVTIDMKGYHNKKNIVPCRLAIDDAKVYAEKIAQVGGE